MCEYHVRIVYRNEDGEACTEYFTCLSSMLEAAQLVAAFCSGDVTVYNVSIETKWVASI